jgi:hypothetical protein
LNGRYYEEYYRDLDGFAGFEMESMEKLGELSDLFGSRRLVVVSNRLPYSPHRTPEGIRYEKGSGGLVTALDPILRLSNGLWIGWDGGTGTPMKGKRITVSEAEGEGSYQLRFVDLTEKEVRHYYYSFSNRTLWPLFHNFIGMSRFNTTHWKTFFKTNAYFAGTVLEESSSILPFPLMMPSAFCRGANRSWKGSWGARRSVFTSRATPITFSTVLRRFQMSMWIGNGALSK